MGGTFLQPNPNYSGEASGRVRKYLKENTDPQAATDHRKAANLAAGKLGAARPVLCGGEYWALDREKAQK